MSAEKVTKSDLSGVISRLMAMLDKTYEYEIGQLLDIERTALSQRKKRGSVPVDKVVNLCREYGFDVNWVLTGDFSDPVAVRNTTYGEQLELTPEEMDALRIMRRCPEAVAVVRMMGAMDGDTQKNIQLSVQKEELLRELMRERNGKRAA